MTSLPSPADSPPLRPSDSPSAQLPSRKRQRSHSMESATSSSSSKRQVNDGVGQENSNFRSPRTDQLSTLSLSDSNHHIDTYMAEQGENDIDTLTLTPSLSPSTTYASVPPNEKFTLITNLVNQPMQINQTWYLVDIGWWNRWKRACTGEISKEGPVTEAKLGPVHNSLLIDDFGQLRSPLRENDHVQFVPEEAWQHFVSWYGIPPISLPRKTISIGGAVKNITLELRPPRLKVLRLTKDVVLSPSEGPSHPYVFLSSQDTVKTMCHALAAAVSFDLPPLGPYRVWKVEPSNGDFSYTEFPPSELSSSNAKVIDDSEKTLEEEGIDTEDAFVVEFKDSDGWIVDIAKFEGSSVLAPLDPPPLFDSRDSFFNRMASSSSSAPKTNSFNSSSKTSSFNMFSNSRNNKAQEPGTLGLGNMGNTCFMNSALQCLAHQKELTEYFLTGVFRDELNPDNPLGMKGAIAEAFGALLERIWASVGPSTSYSPREFKNELQRFAPQFHGYQQHDSQELVAFLLDGLHEDLNRVLKKPYVEKPDWEGGGQKEMAKLAQKSWDGYMMRNNSVIVDLFQGQYQSTLTCPECQKISITFDPFMYLTLPLPIHKKWRHDVYYVPWALERPHVKVPVEIGTNASFKELRQLLGRWMEVDPDNLLTLEMWHHRFYKNLDDTVMVGEMGDNDTIVCFELPCHAQQSRTYKDKATPNDPFIIPVYLQDAPGSSSSYRSTSLHTKANYFARPFIIPVPLDKSRSVDDIYGVVIEQLQRWTSQSRDLYDWEGVRGFGNVDDPISINGAPHMMDSIAEITENGDVISLQEGGVEESDIVDEKSLLVDSEEGDASVGIAPVSAAPVRKGPKKDVFAMKLQTHHSEYGTTALAASNRYESWDARIAEAKRDNEDIEDPVLLHEGDALYLEFDENMKAYYFGEECGHTSRGSWDGTEWPIFQHPEIEEAKKNAADKKPRGITLQDCLDEFTKEEQLGEDDLWYCPRCKKHQQATKKFDLWKAPDVLVVHLKRFSNSRALRDKIDAFVDFPVEGLDLGDTVGERRAARQLIAEGLVPEELGIKDFEQPLLYDLFAVDEHMGGLGGGHYRAYAQNHLNDKWYHFDDSYVTPAQASDSVNANAYLLFYRRRSDTPLGGISHQKVEDARSKPKSEADAPKGTESDLQLPTPPNEDSLTSFSSASSNVPDLEENWLTNDSPLSSSQSRLAYNFPHPSGGRASPTSSVDVEIDRDTDLDDTDTWDELRENSPNDNDSWSESLSHSGMESPSTSSVSELNPLSDGTAS